MNENVKLNRAYLTLAVLAFMFCICAALDVCAQLAESPKTVPGLQSVPPKEGRFVKTDRGYMVPYEVTIPGTKTKFSMQPIPGGWFSFEIPQAAKLVEDSVNHEDYDPRTIEIELKPFWMATHETTWGEFQHYMELHNHFRTFEKNKMREVVDHDGVDVVTAPSFVYEPKWRIENKGGTEKHSAGSMSQYSAKQYSKFISLTTGQFYRLPSAAQWQYACLAGATSKEQAEFNKRLEENCWNKTNSDGMRHEPGNFKVNAWGLFDMHGNVSEWVLDGEKFVDEKWQKMRLSEQNAINWPTKLLGRLAMGGGYADHPYLCKHSSFMTSSEDWWEHDAHFPQSPFWLASDYGCQVGFRVVRPLDEPKTMDEKRVYWEADCEELKDALKSKIDQDGRGSRGIIDKHLTDAIKEIQKIPNR